MTEYEHQHEHGGDFVAEGCDLCADEAGYPTDAERTQQRYSDSLWRFIEEGSKAPWSLGRARDHETYDGLWWLQVWPPVGAPIANLNGRIGAKAKDWNDARLIVLARNLLPELVALAVSAEEHTCHNATLRAMAGEGDPCPICMALDSYRSKRAEVIDEISSQWEDWVGSGDAGS